MLDDDVFAEPPPNDLPDLETLVWKLLRLGGTKAEFHNMLNEQRKPELDQSEYEYVMHMFDAYCPTCGGAGQDGMTHDGLPIECKTCGGRGQ